MQVRTKAQPMVAGAIVAAVLKLVLLGPVREIAGATVDDYVVSALLGASAYAGVFAVFHLWLRKFRMANRWAYVGAGASAALAMVLLQTPAHVWDRLGRSGFLSEYLAAPILTGAALGFLYIWRAGLEGEGDDPAALDRTAQAGSEPLIRTSTAEYFDGPVQVRTSAPLLLLAALLSSGLFGLARMLIGGSWDVAHGLKGDGGLGAFNGAVGTAFNAQLPNIVFAAAAVLPFAVAACVGHAILRGLKRQGVADYALFGAAAPLLIFLIVGPLGLRMPDEAKPVFWAVLAGLWVQAALPLALAMAAYRSMAGLEPKPVREDILLNDRRNLVGAEHARRRYGRVVRG